MERCPIRQTGTMAKRPTEEELWGPAATNTPVSPDQMALFGDQSDHPVPPSTDKQSGKQRERPGGRPGGRGNWWVFPSVAVCVVAVVGLGFVAASSLTGNTEATATTSPTTIATTLPVKTTRGPATQPKANAVAITEAALARGNFPLAQLQLGGDVDLASSPDGRLFVADASSKTVYAISEDNTTAEQIAGLQTGASRPTSVLRDPGPLAVDSLGGLIIADQIQGGDDGRVMRIDPGGEVSVLLTTSEVIRRLYTDDQGAVFVETAGVPWQPERGNVLTRIPPGGATEQSPLTFAPIPQTTPTLLPVAGGRWFGVGANGRITPVSLFGSSVDFSGSDLSLAQSPTHLVAIGSNLIAAQCSTESASLCELTVHNDQGKQTASASVGGIASMSSRSGALVVAGTDGSLLQYPHLDNLRQDVRALIAPSPGVGSSEDEVISGAPADLALQPISLASGPDGSIFWLDASQRKVVLYVQRPDGATERLALPPSIDGGGRTDIAAGKTGLFIRTVPGQLRLLPYDTLAAGQLATRTEAAETVIPVSTASGSTSADSTSSDDTSGLAAQDDQWFVLSGAGLVSTTKSISGVPTYGRSIAVDSTGFAAIVDRTGSVVTGVEFGAKSATTPSTIAQTVAPNTGDTTSLLGLPDNRLGFIEEVAAIGPGRFVVTDSAADRLSLIARQPDGAWKVSRFAGTAPGLVTASPLSQRTIKPKLLAAGADGSVVFSLADQTIRRMLPDGTVRVVAGGGSKRQAAFDRPLGVTIHTPDSTQPDDRVIVVADAGRHRVVQVNPDGSFTTLAGTGSAGSGLFDLDTPSAVSSAFSMLLIADSANNRIVRVDGSGFVQVVAGTGAPGNTPAVGAATDVALNNPQGVAVTPDGRIIVSDTDNNRVLIITADGQISRLVTLTRPTGLAVEDNDHVLVSASADGQVFRIAIATGDRQVVAGRGVLGYEGDGGPATGARLTQPMGLAIGPDRSIYVADAGSGAIRRITPDGYIGTIAGANGQFSSPTGIAIDPRFGILFGELDGRLFSVSAAELTDVAPDWNTPAK
jgi:sugar lactone lactonase YvrE